MFLKTVPPVLAVHSEWRSGKSLNLPLCFNESASDSDFVSSSGTPIPHKVQMIIDSLCSTQSTDMSNEVNSSAQSALNLSCGGHKPCHADTRSRRATFGSDATEGSDSDDSVDRGIEEAIQEYLKGKVDQKHKGEPVENPVEIPEVQQEENCIPDAPKQFMHSTKVLTTTTSTPKSSKGIQPLVGLKKKKKTIKENLFGKTEAFKSLLTKASSSLGTPPCLPQVDCTTSSLRIKEDDSKDSSSDDGIEEAIQRFQQEEKERHEGLRCFQLKEVLDSSSDDGIEEAIRNYQQERQKEREHTVHPKQSCLMAVSIDVKPLKKTAKKKNRKKNTVEPKEMKCASPKPDDLSVGMLPAGCVEASGESLCSSKSEMPQEARAIHSTLTVNTTAELMCAEAILDISKTVMPAAFEPSLDLANNSTTGTASFLSTGVSLQQNKKSDESSVDSEDGIEQEIRKFLELKAKLHEQTSTTNQPEVSTVPKAPQHIKVEENQNKTLRLSFSRKRKRHLEESKIGKQGISGNTLKEEPQPKPLSQSLGTSPPKSFHCSDKNYSSDKSSSLDSDEDLDAAIKDLLKTKKRVKKKVRDMKLKARKSCKPIQLTCTDTLKKHRPVKNQKLVLAHKPVKPGVAKISKGLKHSKKPKLSAKEGQGSGYQLAVQGVQSTPVDEESSSVDSDDSIEQEIRRFLAEKAKGSSTSLATLKQDNARGAEDGAFSTFEEKYVSELQTKPSDLEGALISIDPKQEVQMQNIGMNVKEPDSSFASCYSLEEKRMNDQLQERTLQECRKISMETGRDCAQKVTGNQTYSDTFVVNVTDPQQRKNLFLMKHDNCGISTAREKPSADLSNNFQNRSNIPLIEAISTVSPSPSQTRKHCLCSSSESLIVAKKETDESSRSDSFDLYRDRKGLWDQPPKPTRHASSNHAHLSQHLPPYPSHLSCVPLPLALSQPRASASLVHLRRDQASVVALSGHKSTHLQLKNTQKDTRITSEDRAEELEKCIDETDVESGEEKTDRRQQQCSQSLSTCIDPGVLVSPYIALNTEERRQKFRHYKQRPRVLKCAKRKLQFVFSSVMMEK